jgi:hypothetical protein
MSYDMRPLVTLEEKTQLLQKAVKEDCILLFEHDPLYEAAVVEETDRGIKINQRGSLAEFI